MIIKKKLDAMQIVEEFPSLALYDEENQKYYFVFADKVRGGQYTLMKKGEQWSIHGKGDNYCDEGETMIDDLDSLIDFLWKHRSMVNQSLKLLQKEKVS